MLYATEDLVRDETGEKTFNFLHRAPSEKDEVAIYHSGNEELNDLWTE